MLQARKRILPGKFPASRRSSHFSTHSVGQSEVYDALSALHCSAPSPLNFSHLAAINTSEDMIDECHTRVGLPFIFSAQRKLPNVRTQYARTSHVHVLFHRPPGVCPTRLARTHVESMQMHKSSEYGGDRSPEELVVLVIAVLSLHEETCNAHSECGVGIPILKTRNCGVQASPPPTKPLEGDVPQRMLLESPPV